MFIIPETPQFIGSPSWRDGQREVAQSIVSSSRKVIFLSAPTGSGKSIIAAAVAKSYPRSVIVTKTHDLQTQYLSDFPWMREVKGHAMYCTNPDDCEVDQRWCQYRKVRRIAQASQTVVSNHDYLASAWPGHELEASVLHNRSLLIIDEAHLADDSLRRAASVTISQRIAAEERPPAGFDIEVFRRWAQGLYNRYEREVAHYDSLVAYARNEVESFGGGPFDYIDRSELSECRRGLAKFRLGQKLINLIDTDLVRVRRDGTDIYIEPVFASQGFQALIAPGGFDKVVLMSATLPGVDTLAQLLGLEPSDYESISMPSTFPVENRPFIYLPTVRVSKAMPEGDKFDLVTRMDELLDMWQDRKGIIHCNSFWLKEYVYRTSRYQDHLITHGARGLQEAIVRFKEAGPGNWLLSPSAHSGVDLPDDHVRANIILKLPSPDLSDPIVATRMEILPETYPLAQGATLVQAYGRGNRSKTDWSETVILDSNFGWWYRKYKYLLQEWFTDSVVDEKGNSI